MSKDEVITERYIKMMELTQINNFIGIRVCKDAESNNVVIS